MDDASRGPLGAFGVLIFWTRGSLAALGSIITLLMVAFGPFLQQLVEYPSRIVTQPGAFAIAPQNLAYTRHIDGINLEFDNILSAGVWSAPKPFDREPTCSTGQCSWPAFRSVWWCSECEDRTSSATLEVCKLDTIIRNIDLLPGYCALSLGSGRSFSLLTHTKLDGDVNLSATFTSEVVWPLIHGNFGILRSGSTASRVSSKPASLLGVPEPLVAIGRAVVELNTDKYAKGDFGFNVLRVVEASQCVLNPCEKTLALTKVNGTTTWSEISTTYGSITAPNLTLAYHWGLGKHLCWQAEDGDLKFDNDDDAGCAIDEGKRAFCPVQDYAYNIQRSLKGEWYQPFTISVDSSGKPVHKFPLIDGSNGDDYGLFNTAGPNKTRSLSEIIRSVAVALTNWGLHTTNDTVAGEAFEEESYVHVRWQWIALPAFLELANLTLLVLTIIHSRREDVPLWKYSVLALIYHGFDELRAQ